MAEVEGTSQDGGGPTGPELRLPGWAKVRLDALRSFRSDEELQRFASLAAALALEMNAYDLADVAMLSGSPISLNVVRKVRTRDGLVGVLKLTPGSYQGEAATLTAWNAAGLACPLVLHSEHRSDGLAPYSSLLVSWVDGAPVPHVAMPQYLSGAVRGYREAHIEPPEGLVPPSQLLGTRLDAASEALSVRGFSTPVDLRACMRVVEQHDHRLLHGDAVGMNTLRTAGGLALIDPAGVRGPREFDAARWVVRSLAVAHPSTLHGGLKEALRADRDLNEEVLRICAGIELALEAHQRMMNPQMFLALSGPLPDFDERTTLMISASRRLLDRVL